jgi:hypothetical protein
MCGLTTKTPQLVWGFFVVIPAEANPQGSWSKLNKVRRTKIVNPATRGRERLTGEITKVKTSPSMAFYLW